MPSECRDIPYPAYPLIILRDPDNYPHVRYQFQYGMGFRRGQHRHTGAKALQPRKDVCLDRRGQFSFGPTQNSGSNSQIPSSNPGRQFSRRDFRGASRPPKDNMSPSTGVLGISATLLIEPPGGDMAVHRSPTWAAAGGIAPSGVVSALSMSLQAAVPGPV